MVEAMNRETLRQFSWAVGWIIYFLATAASLVPPVIATVSFSFLSFIMLRELLSSSNLRLADRYSVFWSYLAIPIQYYFSYHSMYYQSFIFIPVIVFMILPLRTILQHESKGMISAISAIQWFMMITVFCLSHLVLLLRLSLRGEHSLALLYLLINVMATDMALQIISFLWKRQVDQFRWWWLLLAGIPAFVCSIVMTHVFSIVPFSWMQTLLSCGLIVGACIFGKLVFLAIESDLSNSHGSAALPVDLQLMNHVSSLPFAALVFFHLMFYWYGGI